MGESGRLCSIKLSNVTIRGIGEHNIKEGGKKVDDGEYGDNWEKEMPVTCNWSATFKGKVRLSDAGQAALKEAKRNMTKITDLRFYQNDTVYDAPDTVTDPEAGCYLTELDIGNKKDDVAQVSYSVSGYGPIKTFGL